MAKKESKPQENLTVSAFALTGDPKDEGSEFIVESLSEERKAKMKELEAKRAEKAEEAEDEEAEEAEDEELDEE